MTSTSLFMPQTIEAIKELSPNVVGEVSADLLACAEEVNGTYGEYSDNKNLAHEKPHPHYTGSQWRWGECTENTTMTC